MFVCLDIKKERIERSKKVEKYCAISSIHARHSNENIFFFAQFFFFFRSINIFPRNELVFSSTFTQIVVCSRMENTWYSIFFPIVYISFLGKTKGEKGEDKGRIMKLSRQSSELNVYVSWYWFLVFVSQIIIHFERKKILNLFFPEIKINILLRNIWIKSILFQCCF